jgi:hypothetical protein
MDNDALDFVDHLKRAVIASLDGLQHLVPASIQNMVLAAENLAGAVASFARLMPTRTLTPVRVWQRASERISVSDLAIQVASETESESRPSSGTCL